MSQRGEKGWSEQDREQKKVKDRERYIDEYG